MIREAHEEHRPESRPRCVAGAKTDSPCGREATKRVGLCSFCEQHSARPNPTEETDYAEEAVYHLRKYGREAAQVRNTLLTQCVAAALNHAEEQRLRAYEEAPLA